MSGLGFIILGNQLFEKKIFLPYSDHEFFMAEDYELCTHFKYHKQKILFFLLSMRRFAEDFPLSITYYRLNRKQNFFENLLRYIHNKKITNLKIYEIEDKFFEDKVIKFSKKHKINLEILKSPMFLVSRFEFVNYLESVKKPFMKTFYERVRKKMDILMVGKKPIGGKFSFDTENRKKMPKNIEIPKLAFQAPCLKQRKEIEMIIEKNFSMHPGSLEGFWLPTSREEALIIITDFINNKLQFFGDYQDAITNRDDFLFHSLVSPALNIGFITPSELVESTIDQFKLRNLPLNSVEGFLRQIIGWREFVRGIYQNFEEIQQTKNFFNHQRRLKDCWYQGKTGIAVVDDAIKKAQRLGYCHHIERLMVLSNLMLLCEIHPHEVYRWFMEMFVDSSDWVMGPNVYGMGQFSDGGIFATKPYISGSNYILKMSDYPKGDWCQIWDALYWSFIDKNQDFYAGNPRMGFMVNTLKKMDVDKIKRYHHLASQFRDRVSTPC